MRISTLEDDKAFDPDVTVINATLDGEPVASVLTADTDEGMVMVAYAKGGKPMHKILRGVVTIEKPKKAARRAEKPSDADENEEFDVDG